MPLTEPPPLLMVADAVHQALEKLDLKYPELHPGELDYLAQCRQILMNEND